TQLPHDFKDFVLDHLENKWPSDAFITHCHQELFHSQWQELLDEEFVCVHKHEIFITCADSIQRHRLFPCIFTYSADYSEKVLIANIHNLGICPCPRCLTPKSQI
ncbi:hypothetical protein SCLCIDRAFT_81444, partial [Scleroderma citrinum Foug A]